jgi:hypothetical protein
MVITVLEAQVEAERHNKLRDAYRKRTKVVPESIVRSFLVQDTSHANTWQIITIWGSAADLAAMRSSGETPTGVIAFNEAGASPKLSVLDVREDTKTAT